MNYLKSDINIIPKQKDLTSIMKSLHEISSFLIKSFNKKYSLNHKPLVIAFDGYVGTDWTFVFELKEKIEEKNIQVDLINSVNFYKDSPKIWEMIEPYITKDQYFGKTYKGDLEDFLDEVKTTKYKIKINSSPDKIFIFYGYGTINELTKNWFDYIFYIDVTHDNFIKNVQKENLWFVPKNALNATGAADVGMSIQTFKLTRYIYMPIFDKHRRNVLNKMDFYIDTNNQLKVIPRSTFDYIMSELSQQPFKLKPLYIQGPWGGQWIKEKRKLPKNYKNCAWAFEAVTSDMSLIIKFGEDIFEVPFDTFLAKNPKHILGEKTFKRFDYSFPLRVHYDDSYEGGNMAIQVHPDHSYVQKYFSEKVGQQEAYYIIKTKSDTEVFLGLKDSKNLHNFFQEALKSKENHIPLNYKKYVNSFRSSPGDLFLIPSGTIHALGKDQVCLEIGTSYGYTFHIYDYLRPDLKGNLREIHLEHAFNVLKAHLKINLFHDKLKQTPKIIKKQNAGTEYLLGKLRELLFEVHRIEFATLWEDDTSEDFHILTLINGEKVLIKSENNINNPIIVFNSKTIIVPACFGKYSMEGDENCTLIKVLLKKKL